MITIDAVVGGTAKSSATVGSSASNSLRLAPETKAAADEEKARKFRERAKRGVLKLLAEKNGHTNLAELHDFSERKYFIAHRSFSRMMEEFVEENHILWDATAGMATLTDEGRRFMGTPVK